MKRVVVVFGGIGAAVPIILIAAIRVELYLNLREVPISLLIGRYLWPTSIWLLAVMNRGFAPTDAKGRAWRYTVGGLGGQQVELPWCSQPVSERDQRTLSGTPNCCPL